MFEPYRKFKSCFFCNNTDLTGEHVFGSAFARWFGELPNWSTYVEQEILDGKSSPPIKGSSPILNIKPKVLCSSCNNGFSSQGVENSLPVLKDLVRGKTKAVEAKGGYWLFRYFGTIGLIIDALTSNLDCPEDHLDSRDHRRIREHRSFSPCFSDSERHNWAKGDTLEGLSVFIGRHEGVLGINPDLNIFPYITGSGGLPQALAKRISFVVGNLAVCICVKNSGAMPASFHALPVSPKGVQTSIDGIVSYREHYSNHAQTPLIEATVEAFEDPARHEIIEHALRNGKKPSMDLLDIQKHT